MSWETQQFVKKAIEILDNDKKQELQNEMNEIDVVRIANIFKRCTTENPSNSETSSVSPLPTVVREPSEEQKNNWETIGLSKIRQGKMAVVLLAGGQGSRLGYDHPKGMFEFGLPSKKSLFQIQAERIRNLEIRANCEGDSCIPWYIMTSDATDSETREFFEKNQYFGLNGKNITFFKQSKLPATDTNGNILLSSPSTIFQAPDGNGGVYAALEKSKCIANMKERGIETIFMYGVDNALVRVADPIFVGSFVESKFGCGCKVVPKASPDERVGILVKKDGVVQVIEYSEISEEMANQRNDDGSLTYNTANIVTHIFTLDSLQEICKRSEEMPYHLAKKNMTVFNPETQSNEKVDGYKYEQFVFDSFQLVEDVFALEVSRAEEFTAIKNKEGKDSPQTALNDISNYHKTMLSKVGAIIEGDGIVEISPLLSYAGENLSSYSGKVLKTPIYLE